MDCEAGNIVCVVGELYGLAQPHFPWMGFIFGIAMGVWRWWDGREAVLYRRVNRHLEERELEVRDACKHALESILWPSPGETVEKPLFVAPSLRRVLARRTWQPLIRFFDHLSYAKAELHQTHGILAEKYLTIRRQKSFVVEQRFSTCILEGAIAAAQADEAKGEQERGRRNNEALQRFEATLKVESKGSDLLALEMKALQLLKTGRRSEALEVFQRIEELLVALLAVAVDDAKRREYEIYRLRNSHHLGGMYQQSGANGNANGIFLAVLNEQPQFFNERLEGRDLLERGHFNEVHGCVQVRLRIAGNVQNPAGGVAAASINKARSDYNDLISQVAPEDKRWVSRAWRWLWQLDWTDGSSALRNSANEGLERLNAIEKSNGCPLCR